jgi:O-antigen ligase
MIPPVRQSRRLDILAIALITIVAICVVPLGGNRPFVWAATGLAIGMAIAGYAGFGSGDRALPRWRGEYWAFAAFLSFAMFQLVPWGGSTRLAGVDVDSASISLAPTDSLLSLLTWVEFGLVFAFGTLLAESRRRRGWVLAALFWVICAEASFGLLSLFVFGDTVLGTPKTQYAGFATGTFVNRNAFATYIAAGLPIGIATLALPDRDHDPLRQTGRAAAHCAAMVLMLAAIVASGSRMGLVAAMAGMAVTIVVLGVKGGLGRRFWLALGGLGIAAAILWGLGGPLIGRVADPGDDIANRLTLYREVWDAILSRPLLGYGGGAFAAVFPVFQHPPLPGDLVWQRAHSTYLSLWFEYGLVAGSIPIAIIAGLWLCFIRALLRLGNDRIILATIGIVPALGLHAVVDFGLEMHAVALLLSLVLGLARGAGLSARRHDPH